jgi:aspartate racemase
MNALTAQPLPASYCTAPPPADDFTIGIVGGIGPAATVDFMDKIIRHTDAKCDQDHLRLLVEHDPRIPDRTAHLLGQGADPAPALLAACKRLQAGGAALIAMPCNTAHAYLRQLRPALAIPVVDMPAETVAHIASAHPGCTRVGLLATSGTIATRIYHEAARHAPFELLTPEPAWQARVMAAIYGEHGVKAGHTSGACVDDLCAAIAHLAARGATVMILGCTELPMLLPQQRGFDAGAGIDRRTAPADQGGQAGQAGQVDLVDPTLIMARRCIALARAPKAA